MISGGAAIGEARLETPVTSVLPSATSSIGTARNAPCGQTYVMMRVASICGRPPQGYDRGADLAARAIVGAPEFDRRVAEAAEHWRLERVGLVERSILRLALAELAEGATPPRVVIDEAVKLAHWFAGPKAPGFVNGVLDAVARELGAL